jgi:hypothetical protein
MTIRDFLRARSIRQSWLMITWLALGLCVFQFTVQFWLGYLLLCIGLLWIVVFIQVMKRTLCPRCHLPLGDAASRSANLWWKLEVHCPHCGVNVDEPVETSSSQL